jgi:23S rRNA pseudouridine1911/1915/1917 synthase
MSIGTIGDGQYQLPELAAPLPLDRALREHCVQASWASLRRLVHTGKVEVNGLTVTDPSFRVRAFDRIGIRMSAPRAGTATRVHPDMVVYVDAHVVVAHKPAGVLSVPYEEERDTFVDGVRRVLEKRAGRSLQPLGIVHRIDKDTSGLLVFTRRASAKHSLEQQFRAHSVRRVYAAVVHGRLASQSFRSRLVQDRGDRMRGSTHNPKLGQLAVTHVKTLEILREATLAECRLETGRTHQIRIHLSEAGHPLLGEKVYVKRYAGQLVAAPRLMLHARSLGFEHPETGRSLDFTSELPDDFQSLLAELRSRPQ